MYKQGCPSWNEIGGGDPSYIYIYYIYLFIFIGIRISQYKDPYRLWFQTFLYFHPDDWGNDPF